MVIKSVAKTVHTEKKSRKFDYKLERNEKPKDHRRFPPHICNNDTSSRARNQHRTQAFGSHPQFRSNCIYLHCFEGIRLE